jgi:carbamoyltransferase
MKILGIQHGGHDSSYSVLEDGKIIICEEMERIDRIKRSNKDAFQYYLDRYGDVADVDYIVTIISNVLSSYPKSLYDMVLLDKEIGDKTIQVGHHQSHAANAFYGSDFEKALIFSVDGGGWDNINDFSVYKFPPMENPSQIMFSGMSPASFTVWLGEGNKINPIFHGNYPNVGPVWNSVTQNLFGLSNGQEGTCMAMAAYGSWGKFYNTKNFPEINETLNSEQEKFDFAHDLQTWTENLVRETMSKYIHKYKINKLCFTGGVSLNCVLAGKIQEWFDVDLYVPPVPYDGGLSIGAAQLLYHHFMDAPRSNDISYRTPYLGNSYTKKSILDSVNGYSDLINVENVSLEEIITLLDNQKIISIFSGRSECGRRALGNRSIIGDPRQPQMKDMINQKVKHRQWYRPIAPSILRECVSDWFVRDVDSPYMNVAIEFKSDKKTIVPAVVHKDGTGRLHTVTEELNQPYYNLIKHWYEYTGVPIIFNTSFNDREPIVETPENAIDCFLRTEIDYLYFLEHKILITRKDIQ